MLTLEQEKKKPKPTSAIVPTEIRCEDAPCCGSSNHQTPTPSTSTTTIVKKQQQLPASSKESNTKKNANDDDDDDSGITLDDLQCCVCMIGDSTDENDVLRTILSFACS